MVKLDKVKWGFIGCGEVTEKKSGPAFALIEGSEVCYLYSYSPFLSCHFRHYGYEGRKARVY